jgi:hypothetical protein
MLTSCVLMAQDRQVIHRGGMTVATELLQGLIEEVYAYKEGGCEFVAYRITHRGIPVIVSSPVVPVKAKAKGDQIGYSLTIISHRDAPEKRVPRHLWWKPSAALDIQRERIEQEKRSNGGRRGEPVL